MAKKKKAMLLGWIMNNKLPLDGESAKNQQILSRMRALGWDVIPLDYHNWKRRPWVVLKTLTCLLLYPRTPLILSSSADNIYRFMKAHYRLRSSRPMLHWVIGGTFGEKSLNGIFDHKVLRSLSCHFVESPKMKEDLLKCGVENVKVVPNFKIIRNLPEKNQHSGPKRFVFVSRIMVEKGVDIILEAIKALNDSGMGENYMVDFYGKIDNAYRSKFEYAISNLPNATYKGILDFQRDESYISLSTYDAMLFPTFWKGEGFAGIFIDAFVAQTPIIASDWKHNRPILEPTGTAIFIPPFSSEALVKSMRDCIDGSTDLRAMSVKCREVANKYDSRTVINNELLDILNPYGY